MTASPFRTGLFSAAVPAGVNCTANNPPYINWGDGCITPVPTNVTTFHQYQTCGTYTVTFGCLGINPPFCTFTLPSLVMPSLLITQTQSVIPGICGNEVELQLHISKNPICGTTFGTAVTITDTIPAQFDITGGSITATGQNVNFVIPANTLPNSPASNLYTLRIRPKYCSSITPLSLALNVSVPNGFGLGMANCSEIITPPTSNLPTNPRDFNFFVTPRVPCLTLEKTTTTPNILPGGTAIFQVTVTNTGNLPANNVQVSDYLPAGLILQSSPPGTTVSGSTATTTISIGAGATQVLTYTFNPSWYPRVHVE